MSSSERIRSHWGWGWADRFPDVASRRQLAETLPMLTGFPAGEPEEPVALDQIRLPASRGAVPSPLREIVSGDLEDRVRHTYGRAYPDILRGFRGNFSGAPDWVARPRHEDEIRGVLEWASEAQLAVVPVGGGTSVVGGVDGGLAGAFDEEGSRHGWRGVVALSLTRLDRLLEVDTHSMSARFEAGVFGPRLEEQLAEHGLTLRHFPQSFEFSTLGGWLATRAGGHFATVYTHIDDLVQSIRMLTPSGVVESRRLPGSGAGPSPDRLVLGSEGAFGIITEAWLRVRARPTHRAKADVFFTDWDAAVDTVRTISQSGLLPSNCRLLDGREAALNGVAVDGRHVLLLGFESAGPPVEDRLRAALDLALAAGGECPAGPRVREAEGGRTEAGAADSWRRAFFEAPYLQSTLVSLGVIADTFETCCPWDRFPDLHRAVVREVRGAMKSVCGAGFLGCRFTHVYPDGPAPYFTWLAPARRDAELEQWRHIKETASRVVLEHGGTITHHHAVGRTHRRWADEQRPPLVTQALRDVKKRLDPAGVLNPGVLLDEPPDA